MSEVAAFVVAHHYSRNVGGVTASFCFRVDHDGQLVGAAIFGRPAMKQTFDKYSEQGKLNLLELRRLCFIDDTPKHIESRMLGVMLRILAKRGVDRVLSYSDPNRGHFGIIYRATGFRCLGQTTPVTEIWWKGRKWSTRNVNHYIKDDKSLGLRKDTLELRAALKSGEAVKVRGAGKFIFVKDLAAAPRKEAGPEITLVKLVAHTPVPLTVITLKALGARKNNLLTSVPHRLRILSIWEFSTSSNQANDNSIKADGLINSWAITLAELASRRNVKDIRYLPESLMKRDSGELNNAWGIPLGQTKPNHYAAPIFHSRI